MYNFYNLIKNYYIIIIIFILFISIFFIPYISNNTIPLNNTSTSAPSISSSPPNFIINPSNEFCWPLPGYTRISSYFGNRVAPTAGASSFHGGVDIPAPAGTNIISAITGTVTKTGFMGSGGCSVVVQSGNHTVIFHHVSPNFLVNVGDSVNQGQIIAQVGPKNVYGFANNPYKDGNRKAYKWCYYWTSSTFYSKNK